MSADRRRLAFLAAGLALVGCGARRYPTRDSVVPPDGGSASVSGQIDRCPEAVIDVSPTQAWPSDPVRVSAFRSVDPDNDVLTYAWTATSGTFLDARAGETYFRCAEPGSVKLTLTISARTCEEKTSASIFCLGASDAGMPPPPPPPMTGTGGASGAGGAGGVADTCPKEQGGDDCNTCTAANCALMPAPVGTDGCCGIQDTAKRALCQALLACFLKNACIDPAGDPTGCFCGTSGEGCFKVAGDAKGPCVAEVLAAGETDNPAMLLDRFVSRDVPLGRAVNLSVCRGNFCTTECGGP